MKAFARKGVFTGAVGSLVCGLILSSSASAQDTKTQPNLAFEPADAYTPPFSGEWVQTGKTAAIDEGGIAGAVVWDNGPVITGAPGVAVPAPCTANDHSLLQNNAGTGAPPGLCLNIIGFGLATTPTASTVVADDFTLTGCTDLTQFETWVYTTGAAAPTVTGATVRIHSTMPFSTSSGVIGTSTTLATAATFTNTFRLTQSGAALGCTRRLQRVVVDMSSIPPLPAGSYWISYTLNVPASCFQPPVTILGSTQKPGSNARQNVSPSPNFTVALADPGVATCTPLPTLPNAQDTPFILRGTPTTGCPGGACPADVSGPSGSPDGVVDINDLLSVVGVWGQTGAPGFIAQDISGPASVPDGVIDINDLLAVVGAWGACPGGPSFPIPTGACCTPSGCQTLTFAACLAAGGLYAGDAVTCAAAGCPANDNCSSATAFPTSLPNTVNINNALATTSTVGGNPIPATCIFNGPANAQKDLWYTFTNTTGSPLNLRVDTLLTAAPVTDTYIVAYSDCTFGTELACNDDAFAGTLLSDMTVPVGNGQTVQIRIGTWAASPSGAITVTLGVN